MKIAKSKDMPPIAADSFPRPARLDEFGELMRFLVKSYAKGEEDWFQTHYPQCYQENEAALKNNFIIKQEGKIVSHLGVFPMKCTTGQSGGSVEVGFIGGVATDPDWRGKGLMRKLVELSISQMADKGYPLSVLSGNRQRYANFGWEYACRNLVFTLSRRSLLWNKVVKAEIRKDEGHAADLDTIITAHEKEPLKVERSKEDYSLLLKKKDNETWISGGSYVVLRREEILECGGDGDEILSILLALIEQMGLDHLIIKRPDIHSRLNDILFEASETWSLVNSASVRIMDLKAVLETFSGQMEERYQPFGDKPPTSISLEMPDANQQATINFGKTIKISTADAPLSMSLSRRDMSRLLFGLQPPSSFSGQSPATACLESIFPLNLYIPRLDRR